MRGHHAKDGGSDALLGREIDALAAAVVKGLEFGW